MELLLLQPLTVQPARQSVSGPHLQFIIKAATLKIQGELIVTLTLSNAYDGTAAVMSVHRRISCGDYKI